MSDPSVYIDEGLIDEIAHAMDLREPNRLALKTLAGRLGAWQASGAAGVPEFVFDVATGVGKTFVMAAAIDYLSEFGVRDFVVFVPRVAILRKTINNFTRGNPKSIAEYMHCQPTVVTVDDLDAGNTRHMMADPEQVKIYVVTVQSFTGRISAEAKRQAHSFQEVLGASFYEQLRENERLVVFADEHHTYYGPAFSAAVRDLEPMALIGLTGTPHPKTPTENIVYRYPLANAIADEHVKRPVIVGRSDELADDRTKLMDGAALLRAKQHAANEYAAKTGKPQRNLLMLVVAGDINEAEKVEGILNDPTFYDGAYADAILRVDSSQPDEALEALERVEDPDSPYRVIVSVAMLKEGWDVATVSVICSLRASVSDLLTEQTLGRGLRLPWGGYVENGLLNELDVVAHEKYEKVLKKAGVLVETLVDWRTWQAEQQAAAERLAAQTATAEARARVLEQFEALTSATPHTSAPRLSRDIGSRHADPPPPFQLRVQRFEDRDAAANGDAQVLYPDATLGTVEVPVVTTHSVSSSYELSDVLAEGRSDFVELGRRFARDPEGTLRREAVVATVQLGLDGIPRTRVRTVPAGTTVASDASPPSLHESMQRLVDAIVASDYSTGRIADLKAAEQIVAALLDGAGERATGVGAYLDQITGAILRTTGSIVTRLAASPNINQLVQLKPANWTRRPLDERSDDFRGAFERGIGYRGWAKSMHEEVSFDSSTERDCALILDEPNNGVQFWVRLHRGDLPVAWLGDSGVREYNPDFLVVETPRRTPRGREQLCWIVEVKDDRHFWDAHVVRKHQAAARWAARVTADPVTGSGRWDVVRASETHVRDARGSWASLKQLGERALSLDPPFLSEMVGVVAGSEGG